SLNATISIATLRGHALSVVSATFSPDGDRIVTASGDKTVRVWNADGSGVPVVLRGHDDWVTSAAFSPPCATAARTGSARGSRRGFRGPGRRVGRIAEESAMMRGPRARLPPALGSTWAQCRHRRFSCRLPADGDRGHQGEGRLWRPHHPRG